MTTMISTLADWMEDWLPDTLLGGLPGRSLAEIHEMMHAIIDRSLTESTFFVGCKADMQKCFDKVQPEQCLIAAEKLGLPAQLTEVIRSFYRTQKRWVIVGDAVAAEPIAPTRSLLQGCPASVLLLSILTYFWVAEVAEEGVEHAIFIDDRLLWDTSPDGPAKLWRAMKKGDRVDELFGWNRHPAKSDSFSTTVEGCKRLALFADELGEPTQQFKLLGISYELRNGRAPKPDLKPLTRKVRERCQRIRWSTDNMGTRKELALQMAIPCIAWQGPWTTPPPRTLAAYAGEIERAVLPGTRTSRSRALQWILRLGADLHPEFALDAQALSYATWREAVRVRQPARAKRRYDQLQECVAQAGMQNAKRQRTQAHVPSQAGMQQTIQSPCKRPRLAQPGGQAAAVPKGLVGANDCRYGIWRTSGKDTFYKPRQMCVDGDNRALARLAQITDKYGWQLCDHGQVIAERQKITFGVTSKRCVKAVARRAWARNMLARDRRGQDDQSARMLQNAHPRVELLKNFLDAATDDATDKKIRYGISVGAPDDAHYHARRLDTEDLPPCKCGLELPNARHLAWHCVVTRLQRQTFYGSHLQPPPQCGLQEAYYLEFEEFAPPAPDHDSSAVTDEIAQHLAEQKRLHPDRRLFIATDGGTAGQRFPIRRSAWAVSCNDKTWNGAVPGCDHSSTDAERYAALMALQALEKAAVPATVLIDNMTVQNKVSYYLQGGSRLPPDATLQWNALKRHAHSCHECTDCCWVPSHGKYSDWTPPKPYADRAEEWRAYNQLADEGTTGPLTDWKEWLRHHDEQRRRLDASVLARMHYLRRSLTDYVKQLPDAATYLHDDGGYLSAPRRYLRPVSVQHRWVSNLTDDEASSDVVEDDVT